MPHSSNLNDYSRYFSLRQKVYLVNMSAERDSDVYESLSGVVTSSAGDGLKLLITHGGPGMLHDGTGSATYKLTSESLGSGLQVLADLIGTSSGNISEFRMHGRLEMFQRRVVPRVEFTTGIFQRCGNFSLPVFKKEWRRVIDHMRTNGGLPGLVLQNAEINLSAGGIGLLVDATRQPTPLSMFFIALDGDLPVCALAETVWRKDGDDDRLRCGFRFIHILKADQERISLFINDSLGKSGGTQLDFKRNWVLLDKMMSDVHKP